METSQLSEWIRGKIQIIKELYSMKEDEIMLTFDRSRAKMVITNLEFIPLAIPIDKKDEITKAKMITL